MRKGEYLFDVTAASAEEAASKVEKYLKDVDAKLEDWPFELHLCMDGEPDFMDG